VASTTTTVAPTTTVPPPPTTAKPKVITDGTFVVGVDIEPGTYRSKVPGSCYWARLSSFTGSDNVIANDIVSDGILVVTIQPTDVGFKTHRCGGWERIG
jgi:hypothetical protein